MPGNLARTMKKGGRHGPPPFAPFCPSGENAMDGSELPDVRDAGDQRIDLDLANLDAVEFDVAVDVDIAQVISGGGERLKAIVRP